MNRIGISPKSITTATLARRFGELGYRAGARGGRRGHDGMYMFAVVAGLLAVGDVAGASGSVALAGSSSVLTWTQQDPSASPPARFRESMAYDPATGTVVLFGGIGRRGMFGDTWLWGSR